MRFERAGDQQILYDVVVFEFRTGKPKTVASQIRFDYNAASLSWSPDSRYLCFRTGGPLERANDLFVFDTKEGTVRSISRLSASERESPHRSLKPLWDDSGNHVYFLRGGEVWRSKLAGEKAERIALMPDATVKQLISRGKNVLWSTSPGASTVVLARNEEAKADAFYRVDLTSGKISRLLERRECYTCGQQELYVSVATSGDSAVYVAEDAQHSPDLYLADSHFANPRRLTHLNPQFDHYNMGESRLISWLSDDGEELQGALLLPSDYQEGNRYPLIVYIYPGGLLSERVNRFGLAYTGPFNMQLFATRGYAVFLPDSPQHGPTPLLDMTKTILPGVSAVVQMGIADPQRIGLMGHSNGGYGTIGLLVQTKRFKAAVEADGMGDLLSLYGEMRKDGTAYGTALESTFNALGGNPWEVRERYIENSPFFYLDQVETPLLIVQGAADSIVDPFLADQLFVGLRRLGKKVQYAKYDGEGHSPSDDWSRENQADVARRIVAWFETHLLSGVSQ
jgi:dipeptidyl aminopeptidase/acylaminoacyl peptidase